MKKRSTKKLLIFTGLLFIAIQADCQKAFFQSGQEFTPKQLSKFYSSVSVAGDRVFFLANDYSLYVYNKTSGQLQWKYEAGYKTTQPVFVHDSIVYAPVYSNEQEFSAQLNINSGQLIKTLPFGPLLTDPVVRDGILYGTAIYNFGCILAYDIKKDTVTWSRFIAHGCSKQPYYFEDGIIANAESDNWFALGYNAVFTDTLCKEKNEIYVEGIPCIRNFMALSHDRQEISETTVPGLSEDGFSGMPAVTSSTKFTFVLSGEKLHVFGNKLKEKMVVKLSALSPKFAGENLEAKLIKADDENVWILVNDHLLQYDHKKKRIIKLSDLSSWNPSQLVIDNDTLWVISRKDGRLYGITI